MKIKTITCHDVRNHGASLQAFALQSYLESLGHEVEVIDYLPDYLSFRFRSIPNQKYNKPFLRQLVILFNIPGKIRRLKRQRVFDRFNQKYLHLTPHRYHSFQELSADPPVADIYIAGSDQIWNSFFKNGRDPAFYLDFAPEGKKRISYAASFSSLKVHPRFESFVKEMLAGFDAISVREHSSLNLLKDLGREDGVSVMDPVFLLGAGQWSELAGKEVKKEKYVLVYDFDNSPLIKELSLRLCSEKGLRIIGVGPNRIYYADKSFRFAGPLDFLRMCRDSSIIISNSFHATAFSLIFHIPFYVIERSDDINSRMHSLLEQVNLSDRILSNSADSIPGTNIDWKSVDDKLDVLVQQSKLFLKKALNN